MNEMKTEAKNLGFHLFGVTTAEPLSSYPVYLEWIRQNRHAGMSYLATDSAIACRSNPASLLPGCQSVVVAGMAYPHPQSNLNQSPSRLPTGKISSYAYGADYHSVIRDLLEKFIIQLQTRLGVPFSYRIFTDSGPLLEKALAQRAGLGWVGKNGCLINPELGSFFFLGEILLDIPLERSIPFSYERCGRCRKCIENCPTQCILPNRTIDAGRCISYLTIENKGEIPREYRSLIGSWIFGCDVCQEVCPWNQKLRSIPIPQEFFPRQSDISPQLIIELGLDENGFRQKYKDSPILRAKRRGYLRNVAVALGNLKDPASIEPLLQVLFHEPESLIRQHAAWALGQIDHPSARQGLEKALQTEVAREVLTEIKQALEE